MHAVTHERLILATGVVCGVAFFVTWEPLLGMAAFLLLVVFAPWLDRANGA